MVLIYERRHRFGQQATDRMIMGFVKSCQAVGRDLSNELDFDCLPNHTKDSGRHHDRTPTGAREV
jgi:hypothetical protein